MITVVALGVECGDITAKAIDTLQQASCVVAKSQHTHIAQALQQHNIQYITCDDLYDNSQDFDMLNRAIVDRLLALDNKHGSVSFCVVGQGTDDSTVQLLTSTNVPYKLLLGVSVADRLVALAKGDSILHTTCDSFLSGDYMYSNSMIIKYIDDSLRASEVKLKLLEMFDEDTTVYFFNGSSVDNIILLDLDRQQYNYLTSILIESKSLCNKKVYCYQDMLQIMSILRSPNGCEWDKAQTHKSIASNVVEEAYELQNALLNDDVDNMIEELGDLLMQVVFHISIGSDNGEFDAVDVYNALGTKLITRHPHVFSDAVADNAQQALDNWNKAKQKEHNIKNTADNIIDVPRNMASLMRARKVQSRASKGGYEFANIEQIKDKVAEELAELLAEVAKGDTDAIVNEGGDVLFAIVNLLRWLDVDAESALVMSTDKFANRVIACERLLESRGKKMNELSQQQFDQLWQEVKVNERH